MVFSELFYWLQDLFGMFTNFCLTLFQWFSSPIELLGVDLNITPLDMLFGASIASLLTFLIIRVFT